MKKASQALVVANQMIIELNVCWRLIFPLDIRILVWITSSIPIRLIGIFWKDIFLKSCGKDDHRKNKHTSLAAAIDGNVRMNTFVYRKLIRQVAANYFPWHLFSEMIFIVHSFPWFVHEFDCTMVIVVVVLTIRMFDDYSSRKNIYPWLLCGLHFSHLLFQQSISPMHLF